MNVFAHLLLRLKSNKNQSHDGGFAVREHKGIFRRKHTSASTIVDNLVSDSLKSGTDIDINRAKSMITDVDVPDTHSVGCATGLSPNYSYEILYEDGDKCIKQIRDTSVEEIIEEKTLKERTNYL